MPTWPPPRGDLLKQTKPGVELAQAPPRAPSRRFWPDKDSLALHAPAPQQILGRMQLNQDRLDHQHRLGHGAQIPGPVAFANELRAVRLDRY